MAEALSNWNVSICSVKCKKSVRKKKALVTFTLNENRFQMLSVMLNLTLYVTPAKVSHQWNRHSSVLLGVFSNFYLTRSA